MKRLCLLVVTVAVLSGCTDGSGSWFASIRRYWRDVDRAGTEHSRQYITSQISLMEAQMAEYMQLETKKIEATDTAVVRQYEAQQQYMLARMRRTALNIPESEIPPQIYRVIRR